MTSLGPGPRWEPKPDPEAERREKLTERVALGLFFVLVCVLGLAVGYVMMHISPTGP